jgi:hypothetical protein
MMIAAHSDTDVANEPTENSLTDRAELGRGWLARGIILLASSVVFALVTPPLFDFTIGKARPKSAKEIP